jgi:hypothetical protein
MCIHVRLQNESGCNSSVAFRTSTQSTIDRQEGKIAMTRDRGTIDRLRRFVDYVSSITENRELHWERQLGSAHRYARLDNHLLILGPATPVTESNIPRYLFITTFDSPECIEINSDDLDLGSAVMKLAREVEVVTQNQPATDPFAINDEFLNRLKL